tara:strand:- start:832 stop:2085 length:1254 start_codon:yes stop_codon:yes gene_type:complete
MQAVTIMRHFLFKMICCLTIAGASSVVAQEQPLSALARVITDKSEIKDRILGGVDINLALTQAVPFRIFTLTEPNRVILDFREVVWSSDEAKRVETSEIVDGLRFGVYQPGWTRLVLPILEPMNLRKAEMRINSETGAAKLWVRLSSVDQAEFEAEIAQSEPAEWALPNVTFDKKPRQRQTGVRPIVVAIDPGHGGEDPGAVISGNQEKDLVFLFGQELREELNKSERFEAFLTRDTDVFMSLTGRISQARQGRADVLISLHADALSNGKASGITVYTLSSKASNEAAEQLATQLDRADLLAGIDLVEQDETVASVLMDLARVETAARSNTLARDVVLGIEEATQKSRKRPHLSAGFTVLKAPDIPSILIELGFLTNKRDLGNLRNAKWRQSVYQGISSGLATWSLEDAAQGRLLRK